MAKDDDKKHRKPRKSIVLLFVIILFGVTALYASDYSHHSLSMDVFSCGLLSKEELREINKDACIIRRVKSRNSYEVNCVNGNWEIKNAEGLQCVSFGI